MITPVTIASIRQATPTVKVFTLDPGDEEFHYRPGQWVDCYVEVDGEMQVGGYSLTSSPLTEGSIELAIKQAREHPATRYLHEHAREGDRLEIAGGQGDFIFERGMTDSLVLIGGGIGINPLMSIMRYVDVAAPEFAVTLLHSATTPEELLFRDEIEEIARRHSRIGVHLTVTRPDESPEDAEAWTGRRGRIDRAMLKDADVDLEATYYLCGPPAMIDALEPVLGDIGVPEERIKYERWW